MKKLLVDSYKSLIGHTEKLITGLNYSNDELIVLCMHSTPADRLLDFENVCNYLLKRFVPLQANQLGDWFSGELNNGPYVLFTFDDGLKNNLGAAEILNRKGITAYFFLVPAFIDADNGEAYYRRNIRQIIDASFDHEPEDFTPMQCEEVASLLVAGHKVGSHTMTHLLRSGMNEDELVREIVESKKWLSKQFNIEVDAFCSPINTSISVDASAKKLIAENYRYHFTTYPGLNARYKDPLLICRRNIEANWNFGKINFALGRWDLKRWRAGTEQHQAL
jgi:peptidoglycan/xylan/chitin deacetylase (PgdA/CDA1 family)